MTGTKTCTRCGEKKEHIMFQKRSSSKDGLSSWCKQCYSEWARAHYSDNAEREREKRRAYASTDRAKELARRRARTDIAREKRRRYEKENSEHIKAYQRKYYEEHKEQIREYNKEYQRKNKDKVKEWHARYRSAHKEQISASSKIYRERNYETIKEKALARLHNDPIHRMKERVRNMVRYSLRSKGHKKVSKTKDIVGCDLNTLCDYLTSTWESRYGAPWNGEPYHIDHIKPLAIAKNEEDVIALCHYTNLRMLTPEDNMAKSDKLDWG